MRYFIYFFYAFIIFPAMIRGQATLFSNPEWNSADIEKANTAKNVSFLTDGEKKVILIANLARINPPLFARTLLKDFLTENKIKSNKWNRSLDNQLRNRVPVREMYAREDLASEAKKHAVDMGKKGTSGHKSSSGKSYKERISYLADGYEQLYENCDYGDDDPVKIVIDLLIDEGVSSLGHRKSLLKREVKFIGVSIQPHKIYGFNCVIELGE